MASCCRGMLRDTGHSALSFFGPFMLVWFFFFWLPCQNSLCLSCHLLMVSFVKGECVISARAACCYRERQNWSDPPLKIIVGDQALWLLSGVAHQGQSGPWEISLSPVSAAVLQWACNSSFSLLPVKTILLCEGKDRALENCRKRPSWEFWRPFVGYHFLLKPVDSDASNSKLRTMLFACVGGRDACPRVEHMYNWTYIPTQVFWPVS